GYLDDYKAFLFDLDGTLINSEKYHADGFAYAVKMVSGYSLTATERREFFESHTDLFAPILAQRHGLSLDPKALTEHKRNHVQKNFKVELFAGVPAFIEKWRKTMRMALVSNSPRSFVKQALVEAGLIDLFELVITADDVAKRKPDPEMYFLALKTMKLKPEDVLVFEDSPAGVTAAQAADCPVIMIENGTGRFVDGVSRYTWKELKQF
ncbi:MAG: HAD family phosphatase, partial [Kiritimatiellaceae bacterium]|nr:HAD family phosphatase [Kiritimatiellaceae bacterium]